MAIAQRNAIGGSATNTVITVTLPTYLTTDYIVFFISSNNANAQTFSGNVTATVLANAGNRLIGYRIVPSDGSQTSFTVTVSTTSVFAWWTASYSGVDLAATVYGIASSVGNNTTSAIPVTTVTTGYVASGDELAFSAAGVNNTATWTTTGNTVFNTTSGNAAMQVQAKATTIGTLATTFADIDRGLSGTGRNESSLAFIIQPPQTVSQNLLANPSFELGSTSATSWETEGNTAIAPQYTIQTTSGVTDGSRSQRIQYAGQAGDSGAMFALYQAPIDAAPGDVLEFAVDVSGSLSGAVGLVGIEGFLSGGTYISEEDTVLTSITSTPQRFTVQYTCPNDTDYVAVYIQVNEIYDPSSIDIYVDKATLLHVTEDGGEVTSTAFFAFF